MDQHAIIALREKLLYISKPIFSYMLIFKVYAYALWLKFPFTDCGHDNSFGRVLRLSTWYLCLQRSVGGNDADTDTIEVLSYCSCTKERVHYNHIWFEGTHFVDLLVVAQ
jgi:hypothetical protein